MTTTPKGGNLRAEQRSQVRPGSSGGTHYLGGSIERKALATFIKLLRCAHWASQKAGKCREQAGLTESQFGVMEALFHLGPMDQTELTSKLLTSPSNLTTVIDNLERQAWVERRPAKRDRRRRVIHLKPRGRRLIHSVLPPHVSRIVEVMSVLSAAEQDRLAVLCRKLGLWAEGLS